MEVASVLARVKDNLKKRPKPNRSASESSRHDGDVYDSQEMCGEPRDKKIKVTGSLEEICRVETKEDHTVRWWKGAKYSPDGSCLLTNSDDNVLRLFEVEKGLETPVLQSKEGECVYDFCWYPRMNSADRNSSCYLSSSGCHPIHLWDAYDGTLRCTYSAWNQFDELASVNSLGFSLIGDRFYAGVNRGIFVFDTARPGAHIDFRQTTTTMKSREGQRGILSTICARPEHAGVFAAGSYGGSIGVYDEREPTHARIALFTAHRHGVTMIKYTPCGQYLHSGGRKDGHLYGWDMRKLEKPCITFNREVRTSQRIYFDIDSSGRYLVSGSTCGHAFVYNLKNGNLNAVRQTDRLNTVVNGISIDPLTSSKFILSTGERIIDFDSEEHNEDENENQVQGKNKLFLAMYKL